MACPETRGGPGWEAQFAPNHLGHYALVNRIWPALVRDGGARVVSVSPVGHRNSPIRWDDVQFENGYDKWKAYGQAKTANVLFAVQLDALGRDAGVGSFALVPGGSITPLQRHLPMEEMVAFGWIDENGKPLHEFKTPEQGAATQVWAATSKQLDGDTGVRGYANDPGEAARLWQRSADLTRVNAFA